MAIHTLNRCTARRFGRIGFTLTELMVVIAVAGVLALAGAATIVHSPRTSRESEGRAFLRHVGDQLQVYLNQNTVPLPTIGAAVVADYNAFQAFAGYRVDLEYYDTTPVTGMTITVSNGGLADGNTIVLRPRTGVQASILTATYNAGAWTITP